MSKFKLRTAPSGPLIHGTPGFVLAFTSDGQEVEGVPPGGFVIDGTPAAGKFVGYDPVLGVPQWQEIPVAFTISAFSGSVGLVLVGTTVTNPTFSAAYSQPATSVVLTDSEAHSDVIALPGTAFASPHAFTKNAVGQSVSFTDTAGDGLSSDARTVAIAWGQNVYTGSDADPGGGGYDAAFIQGLGTATVKLGPQGSYAFNTTAGLSAFFGVRTAAGLTTGSFFVLGFPFACTKVASNVPVTVNGFTEDFDLYRSDNTGLGAFTLLVV